MCHQCRGAFRPPRLFESICYGTRKLGVSGSRVCVCACVYLVKPCKHGRPIGKHCRNLLPAASGDATQDVCATNSRKCDKLLLRRRMQTHTERRTRTQNHHARLTTERKHWKPGEYFQLMMGTSFLCVPPPVRTPVMRWRVVCVWTLRRTRCDATRLGKSAHFLKCLCVRVCVPCLLCALATGFPLV